MELIQGILTRRSIRKYRPLPVSEDTVRILLQAAMYAPSARNEQPWHFIVAEDRNLLNLIRDSHPYAAMLSEAPLAIIICGDLTLEKSPGYWPVDCAAATQNILLAAHGSGLGSVWLGVYPRTERQEAISKIFKLPDHIQPFAIVAVGHADETKERPERFLPERIHNNAW